MKIRNLMGAGKPPETPAEPRRAPAQQGPAMPRVMSEATTGVCLITMARNETPMLLHWVWHYSRLLEKPTFWVVDDASDPAMMETVRDTFPEADIHVMRLPEAPFSDQYKSNALSALATIAVDRYAVVITTDSDEMVSPIGPARSDDFMDVLLAAPGPFSAPIGVTPIHDVACEGPFNPLAPIGGQRGVGHLRSVSTKPAIWKGEPWVFAPGQHALRGRRAPVARDLALVHLKFVDANLLAARQMVRVGREFSAMQAENQGIHWKHDPEELRKRKMFQEVAKLRNAPQICDALDRFLRRDFEEDNGLFYVIDLHRAYAVRLDRDL